MEGDPKFEASQSIPDVPYHLFAISIGLKGIFVDREEDARRLGAGAGLGRAGADRVQDRPQRAAVAAAHQTRTGEEICHDLLKGDPDQAG
jgi:pyruvate dehydrogenase (quinone)